MSERIEPYVWKIAGVVILGMTMSILDTTIVNVALDTLSRELHTTLAQIHMDATGYLLSLAAVIPLTGWAARRFGAKRVYLASILLFTIGSALCGVAGSSTSLILFRVLQGIGGGMIMPISQMIMAEVAGPKRMGRVMGVVVMPAMLAPILGPVVGGLILQNLHWSWIFFVNVPIGIVAGILGWRMLPESNLGKAGKLDWLGLVLLATSMPLIVYGLSESATKESFTAPTVVWPIVGGIALAGWFGWHALHIERPLLDVRLYANRIFGSASLGTFGLGAAFFGTSILTRSSLPLCFIGPDTSIPFICVLLLVRGVGIGLSFIPTTTVAFASLRTEQLSDATPQLKLLQRVGGAIGTAVLAVVLQRASKGASTPGELADAFGTAYWWALGICAASMIPVLVLLRAEGPKEEAPVSAEVEVAEEFVEPIGA